MREGASLTHGWGRPLTLTGPNSPIESPKIHYRMLHWGLFPSLTMKVVPQGPYTTMTSRKEENTSTMGVQQHTMIIYIITSSEVTNTTTNQLYFLIIHNGFHDILYFEEVTSNHCSLVVSGSLF